MDKRSVQEMLEWAEQFVKAGDRQIDCQVHRIHALASVGREVATEQSVLNAIEAVQAANVAARNLLKDTAIESL